MKGNAIFLVHDIPYRRLLLNRYLIRTLSTLLKVKYLKVLYNVELPVPELVLIGNRSIRVERDTQLNVTLEQIATSTIHDSLH